MLDEFVGMLRSNTELPQCTLRKVAGVVSDDGTSLATYRGGEYMTVIEVGQDKPCFQCFPVCDQTVRNCRVHLCASLVEICYRQVGPSFQQCRDPLIVYTCGPARAIQAGQRQMHEQVAQRCRVKDAGIVDRYKAIHLSITHAQLLRLLGQLIERRLALGQAMRLVGQYVLEIDSAVGTGLVMR